MSNVIDSIIANKPVYPAKKQAGNTTFTFNTEGKTKPMNYKGKLLPSKIFHSPIECAKDFKGDIVSIGKAARGVANDHELGRINDLGMKIGSGCLGLVLATRAASGLPKAMEFIGPLTFFGAMSLWPKLAIQAPIKARTGVDVHQEYLDSQGRKKKLFLDPQYVLTDLYSKDDLGKMGDKLKVSKDIPDRDNYIKQRAQKTALQANSLWMLTSGPASWLISALLCNRLEKPASTLIEKANVVSSQKVISEFVEKVDTGEEKKAIKKLLNKVNEVSDKMASKLFDKATDISDGIASKHLEKYLEKHANEEVTDKLIDDLLREIGARRSSKRSQALNDAVKTKLVESKQTAYNNLLQQQPRIDVKEVLRKAAREESAKLEALPADKRTEAAEEIVDTLKKMYESANTIIPNASRGDAYERFQQMLTNRERVKITERLVNNFGRYNEDFDADELVKPVLEKYVGRALDEKGKPVVKLGSISDTVKSLKTASSKFGKEQRKLDKYISARVGQKQSSHIANQWDRVCNSLLKSLNLSSKELKTLADSGDLDLLTSKFEELVKNDAQYDKTVTKLMKLIGDYDAKTGVDVFAGENGVIKQVSKKINEKTSEALKNGFGDELAEQIQKTTANTVVKHAESNAAGARNSFYRMINSLEVFKKASTGQLDQELRSNLAKYVPELKDETALNETISRLVGISKKMVLDATTTDHIEKLTTQGYNLTTGEYKAVMETVFRPVIDEESKTALIKTLEKSMDNDKAKKLAKGYQKYQENFIEKIVNWKNDMTSALSYRVLDSDNVTSSLNGKERANTVASEITKSIKDTATKKYNTNRWLKIFATSFAVLTAITLVAGLYFGRKGDAEKQVEEESKVNG